MSKICAEEKLKPKILEGKLWVPDEKFNGYYLLPESDPGYREVLGRMDSERFAELIKWCYKGRHNGKHKYLTSNNSKTE
jgi:hypothetical protein